MEGQLSCLRALKPTPAGCEGWELATGVRLCALNICIAACVLQGKAQELEGKLHEKELEIERLRAALATAGVDQNVVPSTDKVGLSCARCE
jgi:hypothetical protein